MTAIHLPSVNACLNASAGAFLVAGWLFIRRKNVDAHRACMVLALLCSTAFLASYLYYHYQVGSVRFQKTGLIRTVYLGILLTHTVLAAAIVPMIGRGVFLAVQGRNQEHARLSRWTAPIWLYVSVTGVVVYWMLYRL